MMRKKNTPYCGFLLYHVLDYDNIHYDVFLHHRGDGEMKKRLLLLILLPAVAALFLSGCKKADNGETVEEEKVLDVDTVTAQKGALVIADTYMGTVFPQRELKIYPKTAGEVIAVNVKAGDTVNAGDILFQLNDETAQLDLKSAKTNLSKTQAEIKKNEGSSEVLTQQKEWQELENRNSKIAGSTYSLNTAREDYDRQVHYLSEAKDRENEANDYFKKAERKYDKAKDILGDYEDLQDEEPAFKGVSLEDAAEMTPASGASQAHIDEAKHLMSKLSGGEDTKLYPADVTPNGVAALKANKESLYAKYLEIKSARESQEDKVTSSKRTADIADKSLQDDYTSYRQDVDNMLVRDGALLADQKKIDQIDINSSSIGVEKAQQALDLYTVATPISGVVSKVGIKDYEMVSTGTEAVLIENNDTMNVEFSVTEKVRNNLFIGQSISVDKDDIKVTGSITEIAEEPGEQNGLFTIKAQIPGATGIMSKTRVSVTLDSYIDNSGFVIPNDAVYHSNGQTYVFVVADGKAAKREVVTGLFDKERVVVSEGLNEGESVITSWTNDLMDGVKVKANHIESPVVSVKSDDKAVIPSGDNGSLPATGDTQTSEDTKEPEDDKESSADDNDRKEAWSRVAATTTVFVRSAPDKDDNGNKLGKAKAGDEFEVISAENGWTKVKYNDQEAYIKSDYLTDVSDKGEQE